MTELTTDKIGHGYLPAYEALAMLLGPYARVVEIGVAGGEGLVMFQHLFPNGQIAGVDCNTKAVWPAGTERIVADQTDPRLINVLGDRGPVDLLVDDASHDNEKTAVTWLNLWRVVRPGGVYVIEDWNHGGNLRAGGLIRDFAVDLLGCLNREKPLVPDVEWITYRDGLIILRKNR